MLDNLLALTNDEITTEEFCSMVGRYEDAGEYGARVSAFKKEADRIKKRYDSDILQIRLQFVLECEPSTIETYLKKAGTIKRP